MRNLELHPFLLALLRRSTTNLVAPSSEDPVWARIVEEAIQHGVAGILYRWANDSGPVRRMPLSQFEVIRARTFQQSALGLVLTHALKTILQLHQLHGVPCMPLRGPALSQQLYGDPTVRPMGDLDLLVKHDRLSETTTILKRLGFCEVDRRPGFAREFSYTLELIKTERHGSLIVEPHWSIVYPPFLETFDMERIWQRAAAAEVCGVDTLVLSPADLLLHLCLHVIHRGDTASLLWYYELDRFLELNRTTLDWAQVMESAAGQERLLLEVFDGLFDLFQSPIPADVKSALCTAADRPAVNSRSRQLRSRLSKILLGESQVDGAESFALFFCIRGLRRRLRYAFGLLFPSAQFMRLEYSVSPTESLLFCYASRIGFLIREALKGVVGLMTFRRKLRRPLPQ